MIKSVKFKKKDLLLLSTESQRTVKDRRHLNTIIVDSSVVISRHRCLRVRVRYKGFQNRFQFSLIRVCEVILKIVNGV